MGELKWIGWIEQASFDRSFVSFHSENYAPKLADLARSCLSEPTIEVLPCARPQHVSELLGYEPNAPYPKFDPRAANALLD